MSERHASSATATSPVQFAAPRVSVLLPLPLGSAYDYRVPEGMNLTPGNVLTASALLDLFDSDHAGISPFDPQPVSFNQHSTLYVATLKDQLTLAKEEDILASL